MYSFLRDYLIAHSQAEATHFAPEPVPGEPEPFQPITILNGSDQDDVFFGTQIVTSARGHKGNDLIVTKDYDDYLNGGQGNDILASGAGDDELHGGSGRDDLWCGTGDDVAYGGSGADIVRGHRGDDSLYGGNGEDTLLGGKGDDYLNGGQGNDVMYGGSGADTFHFAENAGADEVMDFDIAEDRLYFGAGVEGMEDLRFMQLGDDAMILYADSVALLRDTDVDTLVEDGNFLF